MKIIDIRNFSLLEAGDVANTNLRCILRPPAPSQRPALPLMQ